MNALLALFIDLHPLILHLKPPSGRMGKFLVKSAWEHFWGKRLSAAKAKDMT
jgi:hypothetical protein